MVSEGVARSIAKLSCDGYINRKYARYNNKCNELREEFMNDVVKEFGPITITKGMVNSGTKFIQFQNKEVIRYFLDIQPSYKSHFISIPKIIKNANLNIKKTYLRAVFDDECSVSLRILKKTHEWKRNITLDSASRKFLKEIKDMLLRNFNIKTNNIMKQKKGSKVWYTTGITGKGMILKYKNEIGFSHHKKTKKIELLLRTYGATFSRNSSKFFELKRELDSRW